MKVKMLQALAGAELSLKPGQEHEGDPKEMARWCESGIAVAVKSSGGKRKATSTRAKKAEKAVPAPPTTPEVLDADDEH